MSSQIQASEIETQLPRRSREYSHSDMSDYQKQLWIRKLTQTEGCYESPIDICLTRSKEIELPPLEWINFEIPPKKIKITNTGQTIIFSAKWGQERPYLASGPFLGKYVFSNWHLHWGANDMEGSEHSVDGTSYPAEMHVVTFKSCYLTQEAALKEQDGCATLVYLFKLQDAPNPAFQTIVDALLDVPKAGTSKKIEPSIITNLVKKFTSDYFMYWGSVSTEKCVHYILWLISRIPIAVSAEQIDSLRFIFDEKGNPLTRNFRDVNNQKRTVFHVNPSSSKYSTLLPFSNGSRDVVQLFRCESDYNVEDASILQIGAKAFKNLEKSREAASKSLSFNRAEEKGPAINLKKYIYSF
nr:carbonic anhydrase 3-like [Leptinotarsa decemlineata]